MGARYKARIKNLETGELVNFPYNPPNYEEGKEVEYNRIESPGGSSPRFEYTGGGAKTVNFGVLLHSHNTRENTDFIEFIEKFLPEKGTIYDPPPQMLFAYGHIAGRYILTQYKKNIVRVNENLQPVHVEMQIQLSEV